MINNSRQRSLNQLTSCSAVVLVLVIASGNLVRGQFLQPQSHLGRLVQSIASPLVLSSGLSGTGDSSSDLYDPEPGSQARPDEQQNQQQNQYQPEAGQHYQHYQRQPEYSRPAHQAHGAHEHQQQATGALQQAPSQQRGIPQSYYGGGGSHDDEESGAPTNHRQRPAANEQYQMGAYLGPTIDDKEIQGAFNSNDDRDDDDAPGYDGPPGGSQGRHADRSANAYAASQPESAGGYPMGPSGDQSGYGPSSGGYGGQMRGGRQHSSIEDGSGSPRGRGERANFDDESSADEDDEPAPRRQPRFRSSLSQAASQYHQHQNRYPSSQSQQQQGVGQSAPMMAAANGYSPMGSGPFDLSSLMAAAAGGQGNGQAYEVYNGDGSYPGYYPQQQQQQQGRRNQAASMNNPYGYQQQMGGYNNQNGANRQRGGGSDNDDADADADED